MRIRITDDTQGQSGATERDRLDAMLAVGLPFMTSADDASTIQRCGEFVRIDMPHEEEESTPRFLLLHETSDVYDAEGQALDDADFYAQVPGPGVRQRTAVFVSRRDGQTGRDGAFLPLRSALQMVRMPRFTQGSEAPSARRLWGMHERNYTAIAGKRRLFAMSDGKVLVVRDVVERGGRFFYGGQRVSMRRTRSARVSRVEVVPLDPDSGRLGAPIFSFPVHSGLAVDVTGLLLSNAPIRHAPLSILDDYAVFGATAGACWGSSLFVSGSGEVPFGGDAGDLYAVCEPAMAQVPGSRRTYLSLLAVYAGDDDVRDAGSSGPYRLTCQRTTPEGDTVRSKIGFPALPRHPNHYVASRGITLLRTGPDTALLRVWVHAMQSGVPGTLTASRGDVLFFWTQDNGATWTYQPIVPGFTEHLYGAMLVRDRQTVLVLSSMRVVRLEPVVVWAVTPAGFSRIGAIAPDTFCQGLSVSDLVPYLAFGFGGVVDRNTEQGVTRRLWMQFDPRWIHAEGQVGVLDYPDGRPLLMVSDDGGVTWQRRFLPTPWSFLVGFVVSVDATTLALPVCSERRQKGQPVRVTLYLSKDGGETWAPTPVHVQLPGQTRIDGNVVIGQVIGSGRYQRMDQDIADCWLEYNRGELHPMLVLRDARGACLNSNPARPWMVDAAIKEPSDG